MKYECQTYRVTEPGNFSRVAYLIGTLGLIVSLAGFVLNRQQFHFSWLWAFVFWFTIAAGGLFFTMLHHLVGATWSVVLRRLAEAVMSMVPYMVLAFLPVLLGISELYHWSHSESVAHDALLQKKTPYLNIPFFVIRQIIYFGVWFLLTLLLSRSSKSQDQGHTEKLAGKFRRISALGMVLFALTFTFASFDWLMSLEPHWYSTIFGVYIFAGALVAIISFMVLGMMILRRQGVLDKTVTVEHYHDLGRLLFAFMIFWAYMAFSQYFLIWYGNIPEETVWFRQRWQGIWQGISLFIILGHFVVPFFILITRVAKRNLPAMAILAGWLLFMHLIDVYWVVIPNLHHDFHFSWLDPAPVVGLGGLFLGRLWQIFASGPLVPIGDPKLKASIEMKN